MTRRTVALVLMLLFGIMLLGCVPDSSKAEQDTQSSNNGPIGENSTGGQMVGVDETSSTTQETEVDEISSAANETEPTKAQTEFDTELSTESSQSEDIDSEYAPENENDTPLV